MTNAQRERIRSGWKSWQASVSPLKKWWLDLFKQTWIINYICTYLYHVIYVYMIHMYICTCVLLTFSATSLNFFYKRFLRSSFKFPYKVNIIRNFKFTSLHTMFWNNIMWNFKENETSNFGVGLVAFWVQEIVLYPIPHCTSKCAGNLQISCRVDIWWHLKCLPAFMYISCWTKCGFFCSDLIGPLLYVL